MEEMGEVPKSAVVMKLTPRELMNRPMAKMAYRLAFSFIGARPPFPGCHRPLQGLEEKRPLGWGDALEGLSSRI